MICVLIIPTGVGLAIGGNAGDANPVAKLIGACCDKLILHPNVVNASDINEMPENAVYVEGSMLDRFLRQEIELKEVLRNKVLVVANLPLRSDTINAVSAARATIGLEASVLELNTPLEMIAEMHEDGHAGGIVRGWKELIEQVAPFDFDALAVHTPITVPRETGLNYYKKGGVNPWGGVEAIASKLIANELNKPVAHAPVESFNIDDQQEVYDLVVDPRIASESLSSCYLHCVLKGLHKAPRISDHCPGYGRRIAAQEVDFMVSPFGLWGPPHEACAALDIPIIFVNENKPAKGLAKEIPEGKYPRIFQVENYIEAAGLIMAHEAGIDPLSVRRPLANTIIIKEVQNEK